MFTYVKFVVRYVNGVVLKCYLTCYFSSCIIGNMLHPMGQQSFMNSCVYNSAKQLGVHIMLMLSRLEAHFLCFSFFLYHMKLCSVSVVALIPDFNTFYKK